MNGWQTDQWVMDVNDLSRPARPGFKSKNSQVIRGIFGWLDKALIRIKLLNLMPDGGKDRLVIKVTQIPEEGLVLNETLPREWLTNIPEFSQEADTHLEGEIQVRGKLIMEGENLRLKGNLSATLATLCTRCGEQIQCPLASDFEVVMMRGTESELKSELDLTPEDLTRGYYDGLEVDLSPWFQEEIALVVPIQPLCKEDCKGLCPNCGADLNREPCTCQKSGSDPRLAILKNLKIEK